MTDVDLRPREVRHPSGSDLRRTWITPHGYLAARLVAELADGWKGYVEAMALSPGTVSGMASAVRRIGRYLIAEDRLLTLTDPGTTTLARLHDWESAMIKEFPPPSARAKDLGDMVRRIVRFFLHSKGIDSSPLMRWAISPVLDSSLPTALPLDEFSNRERLLLQRRLREIVREGEKLLVLGGTLLAAGADPRVHGWDELGNLLWGMRHLPLLEGAPHTGVRHTVLSDQDVARHVRDATGITVAARGLQVAAGRLLAPSDQHLSALRALIHLQTGWSPEETKWLTRDEVEFGDSDVRVLATKNRARRQRWYTLASAADGTPGWKAGDLFRRAQWAMRHAHALSPGQPWFWACGGKYSTVGVTVTPNFSVRRCTFNGSSSLGGLVRAHEIDISAPYDMRRLRKTVKSARAVLLGTLNGAAGDDHSVEVFCDHYLHTTTVHTIAARTVIRAQDKVLRRATTGPTLIPSDAATIAATTPGSRVGDLAACVADERASERDLTVSACTDPYRPPHGTGHQLCTGGPSMCLRCPNAVVFVDHLPRLVRYHEVLLAQQKSLPPQQFHELYDQQLVNLQDIINAFPTAHIEAAYAQHVDVHIPLTERHQHR